MLLLHEATGTVQVSCTAVLSLQQLLVGLQCVSSRSLCYLQACRASDRHQKQCAAISLLELSVLQDVCRACMSYAWWSHLSLKAEQAVSSGRSVSEQMASTGCSDCCSACSAGDALTQDKSSSTVLVHQPASRGESQAELDADPSSRSEEHRAVPSSQNGSHKVQIRAVLSSPNISQKRQTHPRRQQGPLPGAHSCNPFQHSAHIIDVLGQCSPYWVCLSSKLDSSLHIRNGCVHVLFPRCLALSFCLLHD